MSVDPIQEIEKLIGYDPSWNGMVPAEVARKLARQLAEAREQLAAERELADRLAESIDTLEKQRVALRSYEQPDAPGHSHLALGRWDKDGSRCAWCASWDQARDALTAWKEARK